MNDNSHDEMDEEFFDDLEDRITSNEDFLEFMEELIQEVKDDPEKHMRKLTTFLEIMQSRLKLASRTRIDAIDFPDEPSWSWMARLFVVASFDN